MYIVKITLASMNLFCLTGLDCGSTANNSSFAVIPIGKRVLKLIQIVTKSIS